MADEPADADVLHLAAEYFALNDKINAASVSMKADALIENLGRWQATVLDQLAAAPARTVAGVAAKLRVAVDNGESVELLADGDPYALAMLTALRSALEDAERLAADEMAPEMAPK